MALRSSSRARHRAETRPTARHRGPHAARLSLAALACGATITSGIAPAQAAPVQAAPAAAPLRAAVPATVTAPVTAVPVAAQSVLVSVLPPPAEPVATPEAMARPASGEITSGFGMRRHPVSGGSKMHKGVDFAFGDGSVYAAADGVVTEAGTAGGYGRLTEIEHTAPDGTTWSTRYAHQATQAVSPGDKVDRGQVIGQIGSTGTSTGLHLHFEVVVGGEVTDALRYLG